MNRTRLVSQSPTRAVSFLPYPTALNRSTFPELWKSDSALTGSDCKWSYQQKRFNGPPLSWRPSHAYWSNLGRLPGKTSSNFERQATNLGHFLGAPFPTEK